MDFSRAHGFALDEYVGLPLGHPESYREVLLREVCSVIGLPVDQLNVPCNGELELDELQAAGAAYDAHIERRGGIDVQILGIGANGHLGFNEPGSSFQSGTRVKRLAARTRQDNARFFDSLEQGPGQR